MHWKILTVLLVMLFNMHVTTTGLLVYLETSNLLTLAPKELTMLQMFQHVVRRLLPNA